MVDVLGLIEDIYEAGADPSRWPQTMSRVATALGGSSAALGEVSAGRFWPLDLGFKEQGLRAQSPAFAQAVGSTIMPRDQDNVLTLALATSEGRKFAVVISAVRPFGEEAEWAAARLEPHISRALRISGVLHQNRSTMLGAFTALELAQRGVLLAHRNGAVVPANDLAEAIIAKTAGLALRHGQLVCARSEDTSRLRRAIADCMRNPRSAQAIVIDIDRDDGQANLRLHCVPVVNEWQATSHDPVRAMVVLIDPDARLNQQAERLQSLFDLTPAETALVCELVRGGNRGDIAARLDVTVATVRSQLTSIFDKTGVRRQAELVRILMDQA